MRLQRWCPAVLVVIVVVTAPLASAQAPPQPRPPQTFATYLRGQYATFRRNLTGSVETMPAEHFSFRPAPEVMSYGELFAHIVATQYYNCSTVKGTADPGANVNYRATDKAAISQLVKDSFAYCDEVFATLTNENALEMLTRGTESNQRQLARAIQLTQLVVHGNEHYGNLVTYMRMKGIVPPSSAPPK